MMKARWLAMAPALLLASPAIARGPPAIWFDPGSARLKARDHETLDGVAAEARSFGAEILCIVASADRAGSRSYNMRLSRRRGQVVRRELVRRGFRARSIAIRAWGEDRALVETADGVADSSNRFAMIFYGPNGCPLGS